MHGDTAVAAQLAGLREVIRIELQVVGDVKIDIAVRVIIAKRSGRTPLVPLQFSGGALKRSVPPVQEQVVWTVVGDENVVVPVVVHIGDRDSHPPARIAEPGSLSHVVERSIPVVAVQPIRGARSVPAWCVKRAAIDEIDVDLAIVVVVEECDAAGHRFKDVGLFRRSGDEFES